MVKTKEKVLIVEPHNYHYEVLPGVSYYFYKLDYAISLLVRNKEEALKAVVRLPYKCEITIMTFEEGGLSAKLKYCEKQNYDYIFFNSLEYSHDKKCERVLDYLGFVPLAKYGIMGIYHNADMISDEDIPFLNENRFFMLSGGDYKAWHLPMLSASYYGDVNKKYVGKNNGVLCVGVSNNRRLLEKAIGKELKSIKSNKFKIGYIGNSDIAIDIISRILYSFCNKADIRGWAYLKNYGRKPFDEMYELIEEYSFLMFCPSDENPFLTGKTSGTKQLSLGFLKPCILPKKVAKSFGFPKGTCITYEKDISEALVKCMDMKREEYEEIVNKLIEYRDSVWNESLCVIRGIMSNSVKE